MMKSLSFCSGKVSEAASMRKLEEGKYIEPKSSSPTKSKLFRLCTKIPNKRHPYAFDVGAAAAASAAAPAASAVLVCFIGVVSRSARTVEIFATVGVVGSSTTVSG